MSNPIEYLSNPVARALPEFPTGRVLITESTRTPFPYTPVYNSGSYVAIRYDEHGNVVDIAESDLKNIVKFVRQQARTYRFVTEINIAGRQSFDYPGPLSRTEHARNPVAQSTVDRKAADTFRKALGRMSVEDLDACTKGYAEAALWSSNDESTPEGGEPMDKNYGLYDIDKATLFKMYQDCQRFKAENATDIAASGMDDAHVGHNFWLSRGGYGTGFWDRGLGAVGDRLHAAAKRYGEVNLYIHRKKVHQA